MRISALGRVLLTNAVGITAAGQLAAQEAAPAPADAPAVGSAGTEADAQDGHVSAADKAAARLAATQGIELYREQRYAEALARLQSAQALFHAPVHLLYIARCQQAMGQWVEAAETYRTLRRETLPADAAPAALSAVRDGEQELKELEPRVPRLLIRVSPDDVPGLKVTLGDEVLSPAALGVERPQNPGAVRLLVEAEGHQPAEQLLELAPGQSVPLEVHLKPLSQAAASPAVDAATDAGVAPPAVRPPGPALLLGLRLGLVATAGRLPGAVVHPGRQEQAKYADWASGGGELELHVGAHFLQHVSAYAFLTLDGLQPAQDAEFQAPLGPSERTVSTQPSEMSAVSIGLALQGGPRRGQSGPFGELGFALGHYLAHKTTFSAGPLTAACGANVVTSGSALRLGAGWRFAVTEKSFNLSPYVGWTLGGVNRVVYTPQGDCSDVIEKTEVKPDDAPLHSLLGLGVSGDFMIGR
jgi:hypothetical protein